MKKVFLLALLISWFSLLSNASAQRLFDSQNMCFVENTQIALVGNKSINIQDIKKGTPLLGYSSSVDKIFDLINMDSFPSFAMEEEGEDKPIKLTDSMGHEVTAGADVLIFIVNEGFAYLEKVKIGDTILTLDGKAKVLKLTRVENKIKEFNFGIQPWNVIANRLDGFFAEKILFGIPALAGRSVR